jgi:hypothetical protein
MMIGRAARRAARVQAGGSDPRYVAGISSAPVARTVRIGQPHRG